MVAKRKKAAPKNAAQSKKVGQLKALFSLLYIHVAATKRIYYTVRRLLKLFLKSKTSKGSLITMQIKAKE